MKLVMRDACQEIGDKDEVDLAIVSELDRSGKNVKSNLKGVKQSQPLNF